MAGGLKTWFLLVGASFAFDLLDGTSSRQRNAVGLRQNEERGIFVDLVADKLSESACLIGALFLGKGPLCCTAMADADNTQELNLTDPIYLLNFLFRGGDPPPEPHASCGKVPEQNLSCDLEACRE
jgi:hypothetical protein